MILSRIAFVLVCKPALLSVGLLLLSTRPASADFMNGGFEAGSFSPWDTVGDVSRASPGIGVTPSEGSFQAFLTTASQNGDANNFSGNDAVSAAAVRTFLGLGGATLSDAVEGSAIRQTFTGNAGDVVSFRYKFLTTEGTNADFAFVTLSGVTTLSDVTTGSFSSSSVNLDPFFGDPARETSWQTFTTTLAADGTYTLGLGVVDVGDEFIPSALLVDDVRLSSAPVTNPVPAPPTALLAALGAVALGIGQLRTILRTRVTGSLSEAKA